MTEVQQQQVCGECCTVQAHPVCHRCYRLMTGEDGVCAVPSCPEYRDEEPPT